VDKDQIVRLIARTEHRRREADRSAQHPAGYAGA
jgi:hypothetical protein